MTRGGSQAAHGRAAAVGARASLGYAKGNAGKLRFSPAYGPKGKRTIVALVESFGTPRKQLNVASYIAPPPLRPGTPTALRITRKGTGVLVSWKPAGRVARYRLMVKLSDGRALLLLPGAKAKSATVARVGKKLKASATLQGEFADGATGLKAAAKLRR